MFYMFNLNVIYEFTYSCDANLTYSYIDMSTRHLSTRDKEHLDFNSQLSSAIKSTLQLITLILP